MEKIRIRKLRWLCRRGMKELDVLLERFVATEGRALARGAWPQLESLLAAEDDRLWGWLRAPGQPDAAAFRALLERIRRGSDRLH